ncbi:MAG: type II secretion system protein [Vampirovibrionales bacterium]|jgi:Tfp pilus assembly protein PilE
MPLNQRSWAFTIIEFSITIAVIGIMASVVIVSFKNAEEDTDKSSLEAGMSTFQSVLVEGSQRSEISPKDIDMRAILAVVDPQPTYATYAGDVTAYNSAISGGAPETQYQWTYIDDPIDPTVTLATKARQASDWSGARELTFRVNDCGTVCPVTLTGFDNYELQPNINRFCEPDPVEQECRVILRKP